MRCLRMHCLRNYYAQFWRCRRQYHCSCLQCPHVTQTCNRCLKSTKSPLISETADKCCKCTKSICLLNETENNDVEK
ncbi:hypothetical protein O3M35_001461 [Rhynocoris fuscipes]|uniref:Uncharacterized protein n=1 Tax=Rhynocoris fuscipes TaxID=488301 RepID=A0AAW1CV74_9HEMI